MVDDDAAVFRLLSAFIGEQGGRALPAADGEQCLAQVRRHDPDIVLLDIGMPGEPGQDVLSRLKQERPELPVLMLTGLKDVDTAVDCMRRGAADYLTKPIDFSELLGALHAGLRRSQLEKEAARLRQALERGFGLERLLGESAPMLALKTALKKAAPHPLTVLLVGESGTGKEAAAEALHQLSPWANGPFVALDCGAMPANLVESELFGYERGAFSGASARKKGRVELAEGGTLFLDEAGNLSPGLQAKLLRFLQERRYRRLGGEAELKAELRVVAATNSDLKAAVAAGSFRQDLYFRLNEVEIRLPPLREREGDTLALARAFLARFSSQFGKGSQRFRPEAERALEAHPWPGNVRELMNAVRHASLMASGGIGLEHLPPSLGGASPERAPALAAYSSLEAALASELGRVERVMAQRALEAHGGAKGAAARELGVDAKTFQSLLRRHGLEAGS